MSYTKSQIHYQYSPKPTIVYYAGSQLCWREVPKENVYYWTPGTAFKAPKEVETVYSLYRRFKHSQEWEWVLDTWKKAHNEPQKIQGYEVVYEWRESNPNQ